MSLIWVFSFFFSCIQCQQTICLWNNRFSGTTFLNGEYQLDSRTANSKPVYRRIILGEYLNQVDDTEQFIIAGGHGRYLIAG